MNMLKIIKYLDEEDVFWIVAGLRHMGKTTIEGWPSASRADIALYDVDLAIQGMELLWPEGEHVGNGGFIITTPLRVKLDKLIKAQQAGELA